MPPSLIGNIALNSNLSCDGVMAGAFFSQSDLEVPEKKMSEHAGHYIIRVLKRIVDTQ